MRSRSSRKRTPVHLAAEAALRICIVSMLATILAPAAPAGALSRDDGPSGEEEGGTVQRVPIVGEACGHWLERRRYDTRLVRESSWFTPISIGGVDFDGHGGAYELAIGDDAFFCADSTAGPEAAVGAELWRIRKRADAAALPMTLIVSVKAHSQIEATLDAGQPNGIGCLGVASVAGGAGWTSSSSSRLDGLRRSQSIFTNASLTESTPGVRLWGSAGSDEWELGFEVTWPADATDFATTGLQSVWLEVNDVIECDRIEGEWFLLEGSVGAATSVIDGAAASLRARTGAPIVTLTAPGDCDDCVRLAESLGPAEVQP
ncbi:MAG: hypothetical protein RI967_2150 [Planctomycetota bacterium]